MYDIAEYFEAGSVEEAVDLLRANPAARLIAGGSDLLIKIRKGKIPEAILISIRRIPGLKGVSLEGDGSIVIGSCTTFSQITSHPVIQEKVPVLGEAVEKVGGPQIRNVGTIGGNICNGAPSADSAPTLLALDAMLRIQGADGLRVASIRDFYKGPGKVGLSRDEILTAIVITPENYRGFGGHYIKFAMRNAMDIATLGCAVTCRLRDKKIVEDFRLALGVAAPTPVRCPRTEELVKGKIFSEELLLEAGKTAVTEVSPRTSWRASREYRLQLVEELSKRAFIKAFANAGGEMR
ncbi:MAG: xanthine dehydrogenase subunit XdhB [Bacillota bacterium]